MSYIKKIKLPNNPTPYNIYDEGAARKEDLTTIKTEIKSEILGSAPEELNTLEELAKALGQDENFSTTVLNMIGQKQDWNQNNSEAIDYIKNRTHWVEQGFEELLPEQDTIYFQETNFQMTDMDGIEWYGNDKVNTLIVTFDGVEYVCERFTSLLGSDCWGDSRLCGEDTHPMDAPFLIEGGFGYAGGEMFGWEEISVWFITLNPDIADTSHTIKIGVSYGEAVHALDEKFIPQSIKVGKNVEGITFTVDGNSIVAEVGAEIFNDTENNIATGAYSHAEGRYTKALESESHAEGEWTTASGARSHAEGYYTTASGVASHAEGKDATASGWFSHAEGENNTASGQAAHAEGYSTIASGYGAHAEGEYSIASKMAAHAEGRYAEAQGYASHAEGLSTVAKDDYSHVQGKYNKYTNMPNYAHVIGNGTSVKDRSNAHTVDWDGNAWYSGTIKLGGTSYEEGSEVALKTDFNTMELITVEDIDTICGGAIQYAEDVMF